MGKKNHESIPTLDLAHNLIAEQFPEYYERLGWRQICMDEFKSHPVTVMEVWL